MRSIGFIFLLLWYFDNSSSEVLDFLDCASDGHMPIASVIFGDCHITPCKIDHNDKEDLQLILNVTNSIPQFSSISATAEMIQLGGTWAVNISPNNPCISWKCPVHKTMQYVFNASIDFSNIRVKFPGTLRVSGILDDKDHPIFCVEMKVRF
ncbi:unnamed protein product [Phyllotreta striolata]|uniref:MD-2-related lipid-recognition domain-containing protein n=1 Tax=Phyllotreta striolata TaxID=444603 RepID=A0A9N9U010_PHYSR|nr:unnamed protein product [Phyllotreta striolata]